MRRIPSVIRSISVVFTIAIVVSPLLYAQTTAHTPPWPYRIAVEDEATDPDTVPAEQETTEQAADQSADNEKSDEGVPLAEPFPEEDPFLNDYPEFADAGIQIDDIASGQIIDYVLLTVSGSEEAHSVVITGIGAGTVDLILASEPQKVTLSKGDVKKYDVTGDDKSDIEITLRDTADGLADMTFRQANPPPRVTTAAAAAKTKKNNPASWPWLIVGAVGIAIAGTLGVLALHRWHERRTFFETHWPNNDPDLR